MRLGLSNQIALTQVEERLYRPSNAYEEGILTSFERMPVTISPTPEEAAESIARTICKDIKAKGNQPYTIMLSAGTSPEPIYKALIQMREKEGVSFENVHLFPMYEFVPLPNSESGVLAQIKEHFASHVGIPDEHLHGLDSQLSKEDVGRAIEEFDECIHQLGGIDLLITGLGRRGSVGVNSPGSIWSQGTHLSVLDSTSVQEAISTFNTKENVPPTAVTIGLKNLSEARKIILLAWGEAKAEVIAKAVEEPMTESLPASYFQSHSHVRVYTDLPAASLLTRINHPWRVTSIEWTPKLVRRAIVWLCQEINKPILKLTNQDYSDHQLGELLTVYGSAYDANIKVFNDIQHTITGWPGGKPNADDSNRPERALPAKKRVLIFSPHPDDDVISMGGTFRRLVVQGHEVHVAYQTSGNIAVGDEEVIRYLSFLRNTAEHLGMTDSKLHQHAEELRHFLLHEKEEGSIETPEVRFMKGTIRVEEARTADRFIGVKEDHVHFLNLPFYETGGIKKNPPTQTDVDIVVQLLREVKPHQIFVAGDLADPHGTHKVCLDVALAAIDQVKSEEWFKDTWIWMYRGAWAEWEIDHIEMAVPMSPEELRFKRNSILKHQSQMESAPFLGDDERLFWQRSEDRNRATALLYQDLGLASYEAIEAFVRYHPIE